LIDTLSSRPAPADVVSDFAEAFGKVSLRKELQAGGQIDHLDVITGSDNKNYPTKSGPKPGPASACWSFSGA